MMGLMFWLSLYTALCMALGALIGVWFAIGMSKR